MHVPLAVFVDTLGLTSLTLIDPPTLWVDVKNTLTFEIIVSCTADNCDAYTVDQVIHDSDTKCVASTVDQVINDTYVADNCDAYTVKQVIHDSVTKCLAYS